MLLRKKQPKVLIIVIVSIILSSFIGIRIFIGNELHNFKNSTDVLGGKIIKELDKIP